MNSPSVSPSAPESDFPDRCAELERENADLRTRLAAAEARAASHDAAEAALRESEEAFRTFVVSGSQSVWRRAPGVPERADDPATVWWHELTGQTLAQSEGWGWLDALHPDDRDRVRREWESAFSRGTEYDAEYRVRDRTGTYRWLRARGVPLFNQDGTVREWTGTLNDITEHRQAQESLLHQKRLLEGLTESVLDGIMIVSPDGRMTHCNQRFLDIWQFPPEIVASGSDEAALRWAAGQTADPAGFLARVAAVYERPDEPVCEEVVMRDGRVFERSGSPVRSGAVRLGWLWTFHEITARQRAEKAVRLSEERYRSFIANSTEVIWCFELREPVEVGWPEELQIAHIYEHGFLAEGNEAMAELYGFRSFAEMKGLPLRVLMPPEEARNTEYLRAAMRGGYRIADAESIEQNAAGERMFLLNNFVAEVVEGRVWRAWGTSRDISAQKRSEAALRESEARFRELANDSPMFIWMADAEANLTYVNRALLRFFDVPNVEAYAGQVWQTRVHPDDVQRVVETFATAVRERQPYTVEIRQLKATTGEFRWHLIKGVPRYVAGEFAGFMGTGIDIHDRRIAEEALRDAKEEAEVLARAAGEGAARFRLLAETVSLQVWTATPDGLLDWANHYVASYFGSEEVQREILGTGWTRFVQAEDLPGAAAAWRHAVETGDRYEAEFRLRRGDGEYRWFLVRAEAMRDADGAVAKWFGTNTDIHELKVAKEQAEAASRAKDNFLAALSHELRTPLAPVLMSAATLREDARLPEDVRADLAMIERNVALEARLIDDLLDLTRIVRGKLPLRVAPCDAHSLLAYAVEIVRDEAQAKRIVLELDLAAHYSGLSGDPARLQQVFWNLLKNAVKFTPPGGRIAIHSRDSDGSLKLSVSDTGLGFTPEASRRIFDPFEQAGRENDHRFGGLGLGLAIARAIVEMHGGSIHAESAGPGKGATFLVELPGAGEPPTHLIAEPGKSQDSTLEAAGLLRLLVVEDHEPTLAVLTRLLVRAGHRVVSAGSVAGALATAEGGEFDAVISDLGLPDGTGIELMMRLRERRPALHGIALSGYGMEDDLLRSREAGFTAHLVKPIDFDQLRRALRDLAEQRTPAPGTT